MATPISEYRHLVKPQRALVLLLSMALSSLEEKHLYYYHYFQGPIPITRDLIHFRFEFTQNFPQTPALIQVIQEAFVQGVSTRKMEKLARSLGIENISRSQVSEMTKGLNEQVQEFRSRPLTGRYPVIWIDALYEKVRVDGRVISMAVMVVCSVNEQGQRKVLAIEPMMDESKESYSQLFQSLKQRGLETPSLVVSDANKGLTAAIRECFPGASWQRCKMHFMRNILAHVHIRKKMCLRHS